MAIIKCPECAKSISDKAPSCPACGYPISNITTNNQRTINSKSRGVYIIIGLLFGGLGLHNFYSGHNGRGLIKILLTSVAFMLDFATRFHSAFSAIALIITGIWALIEIITVNTDSNGNKMS